MSDHDLLGFLASGLVLTTFWMRDMLLLRLVAIASNVAFITYGHAAQILPVMVLHAILLPLNLWRVLPMLRRATEAWIDQTVKPIRAQRAAREK